MPRSALAVACEAMGVRIALVIERKPAGLLLAGAMRPRAVIAKEAIAPLPFTARRRFVATADGTWTGGSETLGSRDTHPVVTHSVLGRSDEG